LLVVLGGFSLFAKEATISSFPLSITIVILVTYSLGTNYKDLKDIKFDQKNNVYTIPVLLGKKAGSLLVMVMTSLSFLLVPPILNIPDLIVPAAAFSLFSIIFILKQLNERYLRYMQMIYILIVIAYVTA
jgi:1,4-dihydroxy-2-naphthoate octaprenyltransferase